MTTSAHRVDPSTRRTRRAWLAVGFIPVGFVLSMVTGEGLFSTLGYDSQDTDVPLGAVALAGGTALLIFAIPCVVAWLLGRRAVAAGEPHGQAPALFGAVAGVMFVASNVVGLLGRL